MRPARPAPSRRMWAGSVTDKPAPRRGRALWGIAFAFLALLAALTFRPEAAQAQPAAAPAATAQVPAAATAPAATPAPAPATGAPAAASTAGGQNGALTRALGAI